MSVSSEDASDVWVGEDPPLAKSEGPKVAAVPGTNGAVSMLKVWGPPAEGGNDCAVPGTDGAVAGGMGGGAMGGGVDGIGGMGCVPPGGLVPMWKVIGPLAPGGIDCAMGGGVGGVDGRGCAPPAGIECACPGTRPVPGRNGVVPMWKVWGPPAVGGNDWAVPGINGEVGTVAGAIDGVVPM